MKSKKGLIIHPSKIRLMRRLVRDRLFRNRKASQTLEFFAKVQRGEMKYIDPNKCYAEHHIDTFIAYESAACKKFIYEDLKALRGSYDGFSKYEDMMTILDELDEVDLELIPDNSLVREFVGGSKFEY
jgi:uridine kinase